MWSELGCQAQVRHPPAAPTLQGIGKLLTQRAKQTLSRSSLKFPSSPRAKHSLGDKLASFLDRRRQKPLTRASRTSLESYSLEDMTETFLGGAAHPKNKQLSNSPPSQTSLSMNRPTAASTSRPGPSPAPETTGVSFPQPQEPHPGVSGSPDWPQTWPSSHAA